MGIISLIIGIIFCGFSFFTYREASEFLMSPYTYQSELWGDGYIMTAASIVSGILGPIALLGSAVIFFG